MPSAPSPLRVLIVDDEPLARRGVLARLAKAPAFKVIGQCDSGTDAVTRIRQESPDLVFLDVQMPELDGFGVIAAVGPDAMPDVIFLTAHEQYAIRAFDAEAVDYLLKPIDDEKFRRALDRARARARSREESGLGRRLAAVLTSLGLASSGTDARSWTSRYLVHQGDRSIVVATDEIDWIEAAHDYVRLHVGRHIHLLRATMAEIEAELDPRQFARVHRSTIVNLARVSALETSSRDHDLVVLTDGTKLRVGRASRDRVRALLGGRA